MPRLKCIAALIALSALPAGAADTGPLKLAEVSARLYAAGLDDNDAILVAAAAKLRKEAGLPSDIPLGWQSMLAQAETLATADPELLSVVDDIRTDTAKGVAAGPEYRLAALAAGAKDSPPPLVFRGGEYAEVYVEAPSGTDLNLTVLDASGLVVCTDTDTSHVAYCGWTPASDGAFTLVIENAGTLPADYALMTN